MRAGQLGALLKFTSRLEGNYEVSNCMNLDRVSNNKHCKYHHVVLSSFGQTNQLTTVFTQLLNSLMVPFLNLLEKIREFVPVVLKQVVNLSCSI